METGIWFDVVKEAVTVISGVILAGVSTLGGFYVKRLTDKMKMKTLKEDIADYVRGVEQSPAFRGLTGEEKFNFVYNRGMESALENGVSIGEGQLAMLVESQVKLMKQSENEEIKKLIMNKIVTDETPSDSETPEETEDKILDLDLEAKG
jgi:hypothetical protein